MGMLDSVFGGGAEMPEYKAYDVSSGAGEVTVEGDQITSKVSPQYQAVIDKLLGGVGTLQPGYSEGVLAGGTESTGLGRGILQQLGANLDPFTMAEEQFNRMDAILEPGRREARQLSAADRLRRGRLGSTGGAREVEGQERGIELARQQLLADALGQSQGVQAQQARLGTNLLATGASTEDVQLNRLLKSLGSAMSTEALPTTIAQYGSTLSGQRSQHQQAKAEFDAANAGAGFGDILGGLATAGATAFGGPLGGMAAQSLMGALGPATSAVTRDAAGNIIG